MLADGVLGSALCANGAGARIAAFLDSEGTLLAVHAPIPGRTSPRLRASALPQACSTPDAPSTTSATACSTLERS
jgi:hypothetical protein